MRKFHRDLNEGLDATMARLLEEQEEYIEAAMLYDRALLYATDKQDADYYRQKRDSCYRLASS